MTPHADPRGDHGFTLIEIVVAILVLSTAILGLAGIMAGTSRRHERSVSHAELTAAAESKLEDLRVVAAAGGADTVQLALGGSVVESQPDHADSLRNLQGRWILRRWSVIEGPAKTRQVMVRVAPAAGARHDHDGLTLRTLIFPTW